MTSPTVSAVLFDLDGTLIDTAPEFIHIGLQLRAEAGLPPIDAKTIWHSVSNGAIGMVEAALEMPADDPAFEQWRQRFLTLYETGLGDLSHPYPGLPELVAGLDKARIAWGVVTNKLARFALPLWTRCPLILRRARWLHRITSISPSRSRVDLARLRAVGLQPHRDPVHRGSPEGYRGRSGSGMFHDCGGLRLSGPRRGCE